MAWQCGRSGALRRQGHSALITEHALDGNFAWLNPGLSDPPDDGTNGRYQQFGRESQFR